MISGVLSSCSCHRLQARPSLGQSTAKVVWGLITAHCPLFQCTTFCHEKRQKRGKVFVTIYQNITTSANWSFTSGVWVPHSQCNPAAKEKPFFCLDTWSAAGGSQAGLCLGSSYVARGTLPSCRAIISVPTRKLDNYREKQQAFQSFLLCQVF